MVKNLQRKSRLKIPSVFCFTGIFVNRCGCRAKRKSRLENPNAPVFFVTYWNIKQIPNPGKSPYGGIPGRDFLPPGYIPVGRERLEIRKYSLAGGENL